LKNKKYEKRIKKNKIENGKFYEKIIFRKNQKKKKKRRSKSSFLSPKK
jgi:hypothetical protein